MSDYWRGVVALLAFTGVLMVATPACALPDVAVAPFAVWPTDYCAKGGGAWSELPDTSGGVHVSLEIGTFSMRAPSGVCTTSSSATAGTFSAWGRVEREWPSMSNSWSICKSAPWVANSNTTWQVFSSDEDLLLGCGAGRYRLRSDNRITYGGTNYYSPPFVGSPHTF